MRQAETLYTENSIRRVRYQPLGTTHLPCERVVCDVLLGCTSTATHLSADGSYRWGWGKDPCRRAVNRLAQNPGLHINSHATCHDRHWTTKTSP